MAALEGLQIAITGAGGFIGRALVNHVAQAGAEVLAISRQPEVPAAHRTTRWPETDQAKASTLEGCGTVIHLAAVAHQPAVHAAGDQSSTFAPNVALTRQVVQAAVDAGTKRVVLVSSVGVHGSRTQDRPFKEADALVPEEPYAKSKLAGEETARTLAAERGVELVIVRPPLVHGPRAPGNFGTLWRAVATGRWLPLGGIDNQRSLIGIDNLVDVLVLCAIHPHAAGEVFLVSDGEDISTPGLVRAVAAAQGRSPRLLTVPTALLKLAAACAGKSAELERLTWSLKVDSSKVTRMLGWQPPYSLAEGLHRAAAAERLT